MWQIWRAYLFLAHLAMTYEMEVAVCCFWHSYTQIFGVYAYVTWCMFGLYWQFDNHICSLICVKYVYSDTGRFQVLGSRALQPGTWSWNGRPLSGSSGVRLEVSWDAELFRVAELPYIWSWHGSLRDAYSLCICNILPKIRQCTHFPHIAASTIWNFTIHFHVKYDN